MLNINEEIYKSISGVTVSGYTLTISPLILEFDTELPCITYQRSTTMNYSKDYYVGSESEINISIYSPYYDLSITLSELINNSLINYFGDDVRITNISELYAEPAYVQILTFTLSH